jgi:hypothetical protein
MPVNQILVTIEINSQLGVLGTLMPPGEIRPKGISW